MNIDKFQCPKSILYIFLFVLTAMLTLFFFAFVFLITSFILWLIVPLLLVYLGTTIIVLFAFLGLMHLARRKRWYWLTAISLGGAVVPVLVLVLMLVSPFIKTDQSRSQKPNQRQPLTSPSGKYVLTVPIERSKTRRGALGFGSPYWHVTISDPDGNVLYRDPDDDFPGWFGAYWVWDKQDRVWLFGSDSGTVFYERVDGDWTKAEWVPDKAGDTERDITPPESLYPPSYIRFRERYGHGRNRKVDETSNVL